MVTSNFFDRTKKLRLGTRFELALRIFKINILNKFNQDQIKNVASSAKTY